MYKDIGLFEDWHHTREDCQYYLAGASNNTIPYGHVNNAVAVITYGQIDALVGPKAVTKGQPVVWEWPSLTLNGDPIVYSPNAPKNKLTAFIGPYNEADFLGNNVNVLFTKYRKDKDPDVTAKAIVALKGEADREFAILRAIQHSQLSNSKLGKDLLVTLAAVNKGKFLTPGHKQLLPKDDGSEPDGSEEYEEKAYQTQLALEVALARLNYEHNSRRCGTANASGVNAMCQINFSL